MGTPLFRWMNRALQVGRLARRFHAAPLGQENGLRKRRARRHLIIEPLEDRTLLDGGLLQSISPANPVVSLSDGAGGLAPKASVNGRFIVYQSSAPNLVPGQVETASVSNILLYDQQTGKTTLVSHLAGSSTTTADAPSTAPRISGDGRYVTYTSQATDLIAGQTGPRGVNNVFLYDQTTGINTLVSHDVKSITTGGNGDSDVSHTDGFGFNNNTGQFLIYISRATDLVPQQGVGPHANVFLFNVSAGTTTLVSHTPSNPGQIAMGGNDDAETATISQNGSLIAYDDLASNLTVNQRVVGSNVYLYDRATDTNRLVSAAYGTPTGAGGSQGHISADGNTIVYLSNAANIIPNQGPTNGFYNLYRYIVATGTAVLVTGVNGSTITPSLAQTDLFDVSSDGTSVVFRSDANNLVPNQSGPTGNIFYYHVSGNTQTISLVSHFSGSSTVGAGGSAYTVDISDLSLSLDGRFVAYQSTARNLVAGQTASTGILNVFLYDATQNQSTLVSGSRGSATTGGAADSRGARLSADGSTVVYVSNAGDLISGISKNNPGPDVFVFNRPGSSRLVSRSAFAPSGVSGVDSVSADGRFVVFTSNATNVVPGQVDHNFDQDVFLLDRTAGTVTLVSHIPGSLTTTGNAGSPNTASVPGTLGVPAVISADGNFIAFVSSATNLVANQPNQPVGAFRNVFLYDRSTGNITLVSRTTFDVVNNGFVYSDHPAISADGRYVAYVSQATDLVAGQTHPSNVFNKSNIFLFDRISGKTILVSGSNATATGNDNSTNPSISDDGRFVAYESQATNLVQGLTVAPESNVYLFDRSSGQNALVSHAAASTNSGNAGSDSAVISADGSYVAFVSFATNLVSGQAGVAGLSNVFRYKVADRSISLLSGLRGSATQTASGNSDSPAVNVDGTFVAFRSDAPDLVAGQTGTQGGNIFLFNQAGNTPVALVSHAAGAPTTMAGGNSSSPSITGDGGLVVYLSTANNLVSGQSGGGISNVFGSIRNGSINFLISGQDGSPTMISPFPASMPLVSRDPVVIFNVSGTLIGNTQGTVNAIANKLLDFSLAPVAFTPGPDGILPAATPVGTLKTVCGFLSQVVLPTYTLPALAMYPDNGLFTTGAVQVTTGWATLMTKVPVNLSTRSSFSILAQDVIAQFSINGVFTLAVAQAPVSVVTTSSVGSSVYGQAVTFTATVTSGGGPVSSGTVTFKEGNTVLANGIPLDPAGHASLTIATLIAIPHTITAIYNGTALFAPNSGNVPETVTQAPLQVIADDKTRMYGQANPVFTVHYNGFVLGENQSVLSGSLIFSTPAATSSSVGAYLITPGGLASGNYAITFYNGTLTVTPAPLMITAKDASKTYGTPLAFTGKEFTASGLLNSDTVTSVTLTSAGSAPTATVAGSPYVITPSGAVGTGLANYTISYANGKLMITPAPLTITAKDASKTYGRSLTFAGTEFASSGLVGGDTVTGVTLVSAGAAAGATVTSSPYSIVPSAAVGTGLGNYSISYVSGKLTVTTASLTVTPDSVTRPFGSANPTLTGTITGIQNSDPITATYSTTATETSPAGTYPITATLIDPSSKLANYSVTYNQGTLTITPPTLSSTSTAVTSSANPSLFGQSVTFTAVVSVQGPGSGTPTGTVQFVIDGSNAGSPVNVSNTGTATLTTVSLAIGTHTVNALYSGDANFSASSGTLAGGQTVNTATSGVTWSNPAGGDWDTASNWIDNNNVHRIPGAGDDVVINLPNITVTHSLAQADGLHSLTTQDAIILSGGSLTIGGPCQINASLSISGGTLILSDASLDGSGTLLNQGTLVAQGNSTMDIPLTTDSTSMVGLQGTSTSLTMADGFTNNGLIELTSPGTATLAILNGMLSNNGTIAVSSGSTLALNGVLANLNGGTLSGGTYDLAGTFQFTGANILTNAANIILDGPAPTLAGYLVDEANRDALANFTDNEGSFSVQSGSSFTAKATSLTNNGVLDIAAGSVTVPGTFSNAGTVMIAAGSILNVTGTLSNYSGTILTGGTYDILGGTFQFTGADIVTNAATIALDGTSAKIVDEVGNNALGNFAINAAAGSLSLYDGASLVVATFHNDGYLGIGYPSILTVAGAYSQSAGASIRSFGTLNLAGGGSADGAITNGGSLVIGGGTFSVPGTFANNDASTSTDGILTVEAGATFAVTGTFADFDTSSMTLTSGTYAISGSMQLYADIVRNAATIVLDGTGQIMNLATNNSSLANFATNASGGSFTIQDGALFQAAGDFSNTGSLEVDTASAFIVPATGTFSNEGVLTVDAGGTFTVSGAFTNFDSNSMTLVGGNYIIGGTIQVYADLLRNAATIVLDGSGQIVNLATNNSALRNLTVNDGTLSIQDGALFQAAGDFSNTGSLEVGTGSAFTVPATGTFSNAGVLTVDAGGAFTVSGTFANFDTNSKTLEGGSYVLSGTMQVYADLLRNAATIVLDGGGQMVNLATNNSALLNLSTNAVNGDLTIQDGAQLTTAGDFTNAGSLSVNGGSVLVSGRFVNSGSVGVLKGSSLMVSLDYLQSSGSTVLNNAALSAAGLIDLQAGVLSGSGTIYASVQNDAGVIEVGGSGTAGLLSISGNYTQTATGVLDLGIGGTNAGTDFDQLTVGGTAALGGTLNISLINGFEPVPGEAFQVLTFGSHSADFALENGLDLGGGLRLNPQYDNNGLTLFTMGGNAAPPAPRKGSPGGRHLADWCQAVDSSLQRKSSDTGLWQAGGAVKNLETPRACLDALFRLVAESTGGIGEVGGT